MVEFAIVCLIVYVLLAAILTFGQLLFCDQTLQPAADLAARELARTPLPANATFYQALQDPGVRGRVFDERYLVLSIDTPEPDSKFKPMTFNGGYRIGDFPLVIQQLFPIFIYDELVPEMTPGPGIAVMRYPGAVFTDPNPMPNPPYPPASGYLVRIPVLEYPSSPPAEIHGVPAQQVGWAPVLEEIQSTPAPTPIPNPNPIPVPGPPQHSSSFPVSSSQQGIVALRFNYPYQSASMSGFQPPVDPTSLPGPPANPVSPIIVNGTTYLPPPQDVGQPMVSAMSEGFVPYGGHYSLGQQAAWTQTQGVRPYRRVISAQAIYRREVFQ